MKTFVKFSLLCIIYLNCISCDPADGKLEYYNNSNDTIFFDTSCNTDSINYPIIIQYGIEVADNIPPKSRVSNPIMGTTWETFINKECKDSTLRVFFFKRDLIRNHSKEWILKHQYFSKMYKLKVNELKKLNWKLEYP